MNQRPNPSLRPYVNGVIVVGGVVLLDAAIRSLSVPHPLGWLLLGALAFVTGSFKLNIQPVSASISVSDTFFIASALLFGPAPATVLVALDSAIMSCRRRDAVPRVLFNAVAPALGMFAGAQVFFWLAGVPPLAFAHASVTPLVVPLLSLALTYYGINSGLVAAAIGLESGASPFRIWREHLLWLSVGYLASASVAFCLILLIQEASVLAAVVLLPLIAVFHLTLRATFGRLEDAHRHVAAIDRLYLSTVETLAMAIDAKDDVTHSHVRRVQAYAMALAHAVNVADEPTLKAIEAAALLHDTGKLAVPEHILNKPGKLTAAEFEKMKLHVDIGADILSLVGFPYPVEPIVRCHHENWDGSGYPRGVTGEAIPIGARILSVVDCYDALTSDRPYRRALSDEDAIAILRERSGTMYDPVIVETFIAIYHNVAVTAEETPEQREVLARISATKRADDAPAVVSATPAGMTHDLMTFVSLSRIAAGDVTVFDVLAVASNLVADIVPGVTGAWHLRQDTSDRLVVVNAFGPASPAVAGRIVGIGDRLTGWVAASRLAVVDSDAALDLGGQDGGAAAGLRRCTSVPLTVGETLVAVLTLYSPDTNAFSGERGRLVQVIAPHLATAIHAALAADERRGSSDSRERIPSPARELRLVSTR